MNKTIFFAVAMLFFSAVIFAQTKNKTEAQRKKDSVQLAEVKRKYPDNFRFNIAPITLTDKSQYASGYMGGLRIIDNTISDSIYRNYHADMPDTSSEIPYAAISVIGERVNVQFLQYGFIGAWTNPSKNSIELITNTIGIDKALLPFKGSEKFFSKRSIRISINGKPIFNWKNLSAFKRQLYKESSYTDETNGMFAYEYVFSLCDTTIGINDQLFIEIKEDSLNQMVDSYNITRKAAFPKVSAIQLLNQNGSVVADNAGSEPGEKKNFTLNASTEEILIPLPDNNIPVEYLYKKNTSAEAQWTTLGSESHSIKLIVNSGYRYDLLLRYAIQKESIAKYTISVNAYLWQTAAFKIITGSVIGLLLFLIAVYIYAQKKKLQQVQSDALQKQHLLELKSIQAQLNPHFVFNSLNSIQGLMNTGKIDEANQYLSEFSMLMRDTLNDTDTIFSTIASEIKKLKQYLNLEQLRFGFAYSINAAEGTSTSTIEIPTLLLQPIVENAIKHGVAAKGNHGKIEINFLHKNKDLVITIADNGDGFNITRHKKGYGLNLTSDRIKLINSIHKNSFIEQKIISDSNGTIVTIIFKQWL